MIYKHIYDTKFFQNPTAIVFVALQLVLLCGADISLISNGNNFGEGYDYPKPNIPFETGFKKNAVVETPSYLPPEASTTAR